MAGNIAPNIIDNGLILYLDAANTRSYPTTGTAWTDLSKSVNNGTLINGPTFSNNNGGYFSFDGVNDYVVIGNNGDFTTASYTLETWFYPQFDSATFGRSMINKAASCSSAEFGLDYGRTANKISFVTRNDLTLVSTNTYPSNNWYLASLTRKNNGNGTYTSILYVNGVLDNTTTVSYAPSSGAVNLYIGGAIVCPSIDTFLGRIASVKIYNQVLTPTEVLQNYNSTKSRFGL